MAFGQQQPLGAFRGETGLRVKGHKGMRCSWAKSMQTTNQESHATDCLWAPSPLLQSLLCRRGLDSANYTSQARLCPQPRGGAGGTGSCGGRRGTIFWFPAEVSSLLPPLLLAAQLQCPSSGWSHVPLAVSTGSAEVQASATPLALASAKTSSSFLFPSPGISND